MLNDTHYSIVVNLLKLIVLIIMTKLYNAVFSLKIFIFKCRYTVMRHFNLIFLLLLIFFFLTLWELPQSNEFVESCMSFKSLDWSYGDFFWEIQVPAFLVIPQKFLKDSSYFSGRYQ